MHLTRQDLYSLEDYARIREDFRARVMARRRLRSLPIGDRARLCFEDRLTIQYQIQEMLRVERIFESAAIQEELDAYNPLIPDGSNWKATLMLEYPDRAERRRALARLRGIETRVWGRVGGHDRVWAIADEDLERADETRTAAVHFLRFELTPDMAAAMRDGTALTLGIEHPEYTAEILAWPATRDALAEDLDRAD